MSHFDHEKLDVYGVAIDFVALANSVAERRALPRTTMTRLLRIVAMLTQIVRRREESGTGSGTLVRARKEGETRARFR